MKGLLNEIKGCTLCAALLPHDPNPIVVADKAARILIIGQAPGKKVHETNVPWNDPSGDQLRSWMGVDESVFYDPSRVALVPMGFCYPGKGKSGDLPPRPECAPTWHMKLLHALPNVRLTLLIGQYAQNYYLKDNTSQNLTETVRSYASFLPSFLPLPHPSPRNRFWLKKNEWFEREVVPQLRKIIKELI